MAQKLSIGVGAMASSPTMTTLTGNSAGKEVLDDFINTDLRDWKALVHAQIDEHQGMKSLTCQQFKVSCDLATFESHFVDCKIASTKCVP